MSFQLFNRSFCFLGSHLAARIDENRLHLRNQNYRDILSRLPFTNNGDNHHEFDYFFWMGDLNYRIEMPRDNIIQAAESGNYQILLENDQLYREMSYERCFIEFEEHEINFMPTYRFNRGFT